MPYDHDMGRDLRRLIPLLIANLITTILVSAAIIRGLPPCLDDHARPVACSIDVIGVNVVGIWFAALFVQAVAQVGFLVLMLLVQRIPLAFRLPVLLVASAGSGCALLWQTAPFVGAVAGLVRLTGWLYALRDRIQ